MFIYEVLRTFGIKKCTTWTPLSPTDNSILMLENKKNKKVGRLTGERKVGLRKSLYLYQKTFDSEKWGGGGGGGPPPLFARKEGKGIFFSESRSYSDFHYKWNPT